MMKWRFRELLGEYQQRTGQGLRYEDIASATGISTNSLSLIGTNKAKRADLQTIDRLLGYMSQRLERPLTTNDLLEHIEN